MLVSHANSTLNSPTPTANAKVLNQPLEQADTQIKSATQTTSLSANASVQLQQDTVTLSATALSLSANSSSTTDTNTPSTKPELPHNGDKATAYVEYRKAKMQYQIYSDMANIATGSDKSVSPTTAYYLSNNDQARAATVDAKSQQQQVSAMQTYAETTQAINNS